MKTPKSIFVLSCLVTLPFAGALAALEESFKAPAPPTVEDRFRVLVDHPANLTPSEYVGRMEALLDENPSTRTRALIASELGIYCAHSRSEDMKLSLDLENKGQRYLGMALDAPWPIDRELELSCELVSSVKRTISEGGSIKSIADIDLMGKVILKALDRAQIANVPDQPALIINSADFGQTLEASSARDAIVTPVEANRVSSAALPFGSLERTAAQKLKREAEAKRNARIVNDYQAEIARRVEAPRFKQKLENELVLLYSPKIETLNELKEMCRINISDQTFAAQLISKVSDACEDPAIRESIRLRSMGYDVK